MTTNNYYEVLGLAPFAEGAIVDQAYWHLAKTYQALAEADPRARQALDDLNEAYAVLGTPRLREEYDASMSGVAKWRQAAPREPRSNGFRFRLPSWPFSKPAAEPVAEERLLALNPSAPAPQIVAAPPPARVEPAPAAPTPRARKGDVLDLHASTARMLERWRASADASAKASVQPAEDAPDMTLVDIFKSEQEIESKDDPLAAVMEILKAPPDRVPSATPPQT
jgi:hypothetical protein